MCSLSPYPVFLCTEKIYEPGMRALLLHVNAPVICRICWHGLCDDSSTTASEALVIMAVGLKARWKAPISFHIAQGCTADAQAQLLRHAVIALCEQNICVRTWTMDGYATNIATARVFGASLETGEFDFQHEGQRVSFLIFHSIFSNKVWKLRYQCLLYM